MGEAIRALLIVSLIGMGLAACVTETRGGFNTERSPERAAAARVDLAKAYLQENRPEEAINSLLKALADIPEHPEALAMLGVVYHRQADLEQAEEQFKRALKADADYTPARVWYADFLYRQTRYNEALEQLQRAALDLGYDRRDRVYENIGLVSERLGQTDQALEAYRKSAALGEPSAKVLLGLARIGYEQAQHAEAWRYYQAWRNRMRAEKRQQSAAALRLGVLIARAVGDADQASSLMLLLRNMYGHSAEYRSLKEGG